MDKNIIALKDVKKLANMTTIFEAEDYSGKIIYGDEYSLSRFNTDQDKQVDLKDLEVNWNNKWNSFNGWTEERQNYRFLYEHFSFFHNSFNQLRINKVFSINNTFEDKKRVFILMI